MTRVTFALAAATLTISTACTSVRSHLGGGPAPEYMDALATAQSRVGAGDFDGADTVLARFARTHPNTPEALETVYWRGLFKLDPSNRSASIPQALAAFDGYLADTRPRMHATEAATLRRSAAQLDALTRLAASASSQAKDASSAAANAKANAADAKADAKAADANAAAVADAKDAEIKKLRDDLAKANAELDRIKKRLSQPPGKP